jgi:hypothetical protein
MRAETFKPAKIPSDIMKKVYTFNQGGKLCLRTHTIDKHVNALKIQLTRTL